MEAWQGIFNLFKPDALVIDNGPSALVAALVSGLPRLVLGDEHTLPAPFGAAPPGPKVQTGEPAARLRSSERRVAETVASVMRMAISGSPPSRMQTCVSMMVRTGFCRPVSQPGCRRSWCRRVDRASPMRYAQRGKMPRRS